MPAAVSRTSRIMARWLAAPAFTDRRGTPLAAAARPSERPRSKPWSTSVTRDVRPRAVLDEWLDRRLVAIDAHDRVVLLEAAFVPRGDGDQQLYYFGRNLHDHLAAAVANVLGAQPRFFETGRALRRAVGELAAD